MIDDGELIAILEDWPYQGETYAEAAAYRIEVLVDRIEALEAENVCLRSLLRVFKRELGKARTPEVQPQRRTT